MKKLFLALCVTVCLLFSVTVTPVRADEGNGHDPGYVCVESETVDCPPNVTPPPPSVTSGSNNDVTPEEEEEGGDTLLTLLELVIALLS